MTIEPSGNDGIPTFSRRRVLGTGLAGALALATTACSPTTGRGAASPASRTDPPSSPPPDPATVHANELGLVPILMHHRIVEQVDSEFDMTPAYFRAELQRLYRENYHPVRTLDLVRRTFTVPAGKTPVVLTFDDGSPGQFGYRPDGTINPECGVGILLDFHAAHRDFPAVASFYINRDPFGTTTAQDAARALADLHTRGFEIGNHTYDHANLSTLSAEQVQAEFARLAQLVTAAVPGLNPHTMALLCYA